MSKSLVEIHEDVSPEHYDRGIRQNLFQKIWHTNRFKKVCEIVNPTEGNVLDIGCHSGTFTKVLLDKLHTKNIYGIDISKESIQLIKKRIPDGHFQIADATKLPFKNNFFETVFCLEMLEHIDSPLKALKEMKRVLKTGGDLVILIPSETFLFKLVWFIWTLYYPLWKHAHVQNFHDGDIEKILQQNNFQISLVKKINLGMLRLILARKIQDG